jgi:hypothetical protein
MSQKKSQGGRSDMSGRAILLAVAVVVLAGAWMWGLAWTEAPIRSAPIDGGAVESRPLTESDFRNASGLMAAVAKEAQRRLLAAGRFPGQGREVLPLPLWHLHVVTTYVSSLENAMISMAGLEMLMEGAAPALPPWADLVAALRDIGQSDLAAAAEELRLSAGDGSAVPSETPEAAPRPAGGTCSNALGRLRAGMAKPGFTAACVAYARKHREEILKP